MVESGGSFRLCIRCAAGVGLGFGTSAGVTNASAFFILV